MAPSQHLSSLEDPFIARHPYLLIIPPLLAPYTTQHPSPTWSYDIFP